jgi:hypothetical protein
MTGQDKLIIAGILAGSAALGWAVYRGWTALWSGCAR